MNIHSVRSEVTKVELREIALVPYQMISPAKSRSMTGILQDGLSAIYKCTVEDTPIDAKRFYNVLLADTTFNGHIKIHKDGVYYGKDIFSHILPPLNFHQDEVETIDDYIKPLRDIVDRIKFELFINHIDPDHISYQRVPELQKIVSQSIKVYLGEYKKTPKNIIGLLQKIDKKLLTNKPHGLKTLVNQLDKATKIASRVNTTRKVTLDVRQGILNKGVLGKAQFKSGGGDYNFIYRTWEDFGPMAAKDLVTKVQKTMDNWLVGEGHTIGMGDMLVSKEDVRSEITLSVLKGLEAYHKLEMDTIHENLIPGIGRTIEDEFETQSMQIFNDVFSSKIPTIITKYLKTTPNHMHIMVASGAKGNIINETQIMGVVGPIAIGGKRFPKSYGNRSLPHYQKYSNNATSRGFAANSFVDGLSPQEFFISMASGREGCIDTAIKSVTGDTPIVIIENNKPKRVLIGDWIDHLLLQNEDRVEHYTEREMELLKLTDTEVTIPTSDLKGNVSWGKISAITRHDPGKELYKIKTHGGREVIVTESKSLLVWNKSTNEFVRMNTPDVKVGDYVPVTKYLPMPSNWNTDNVDGITQTEKDIINANFNGTFINSNTLKEDRAQVQNDVVLDKIVSIDPISIEEYPKVYDLTVPSTLNFGIANGLHVVDTAQSGYISRRLMKAMEDYMANYDTSVRNSMGRIIQFIYSGHGLDPVYCTHTALRFINCSYTDMNKFYLFTNNELEAILDPDVYKSTKEFKNILKDEYNCMVYYQKVLREYIYRDYTEADVTFMSPINLDIELLNVKTNFGITKRTKGSLLDPVYVSRKINGLCSIIPQLYSNTSFHMNKDIPLISELNWPKQDPNDPLDVEAFFEHIDSHKSEYYPVTLLFCIYVRSHLSSKSVVYRHHLTKEAFDYLIDQIIYKYTRAIISPGEMVGSLAAQSIGEPTTQATLNSVDYKQRILVGRKIGTKGGKMVLDIKEVPIGRFVEKCLGYLKNKGIDRTNNDRFKYFDYRNERKDHAEYGEIENMKFYAISSDRKGNLRWNKITGVSKHLPINEDMSNTLIKVTLANGSVVRATRGHSFLVREPEGLVRKEGKTLKIGDYIPVMKDFPMEYITELEYLDLSKYFPKNEYIWGSEMKKAEMVMNEYNARGNRHWFSCNNGKLFTIPYSRSDIARCAFDNDEVIHDSGYIYSKYYSRNCLPEKMPLDEDFGFLIGIYLAEGNLNGARKNKILISNNDKRIRDRVESYVKKFDVNCHTQIQKDKFKEGWTSTTITIHSAIFANLIEKICGLGSDKKFVAPFIYNSNLEFIKGVLSGYISGDGCIHNTCATTISSVSKKLLKGIGQLLSRLGIIYRIKTLKKMTENNLGTSPENIKQKYALIINVPGTIKLVKNITLYKNYNDDRFETIKLKKCKYSFSQNDIIPNVIVGSQVVDIHRDALRQYINKQPSLQNIINSNVYYSKIVKIEYVEPSNGYTYDITVDGDHTFLVNSIVSHNTFHLSGVAAKSSVLSGIPRMEELFRVTKKIKTPMMDVFLDSSIMDNKHEAKIIANSIEHTTLADFAKNIGIWFDPVANKTIVEDDKEFVKSYFDHTVGSNRINLDRLSKFMIRIELDKHKTIYKQMRMNYLKYQLQKYKNGYFYVIHSDDNADHLVLHIRMNLDNVTTKYIDELDLVRKSKDLIMDKVEIRGIKGVNSAQIDNSGEKIYVYNPENGKREQKDQWIIYTDGTNLKYTLGQPGVNSRKVVTTDVYEVSQVLGIEAGRSMLFREFHDTYTKAVSTINYNHLSILVDIMTYGGHLMPISRHGINRTDNSPLTKASFEETQEQLAEAGVYGVLDNMKSVASCTMIAQTNRLGTCGPFDIIYDYKNKGVTADSIDSLLE